MCGRTLASGRMSARGKVVRTRRASRGISSNTCGATRENVSSNPLWSLLFLTPSPSDADAVHHVLSPAHLSQVLSSVKSLAVITRPAVPGTSSDTCGYISRILPRYPPTSPARGSRRHMPRRPRAPRDRNLTQPRRNAPRRARSGAANRSAAARTFPPPAVVAPFSWSTSVCDGFGFEDLEHGGCVAGECMYH